MTSVAPFNGGSQRGAVEDVKCLFTVRCENGQCRKGSTFRLVGCPAAGNHLERLIIAKDDFVIMF